MAPSDSADPSKAGLSGLGLPGLGQVAVACVDLPALPLQLLLRRHRSWIREPVAVLDREDPQGIVLWVNPKAHQARVRTGMRYGAALSLVANLCGGVVERGEIAAAVRELTGWMQRHAPLVEPCAWPGEPGVFWLGVQGMERLHRDWAAWGREVRGALREHGFGGSVAVGFDRFGSFALARQMSYASGGRKVMVCASAVDERARSARVPLDLLNIDPKVRDALEQLGVRDVGHLRRLPAGGLEERFGRAAHDLHLLVDGARSLPVQGEEEEAPDRERFEVDPECPAIDRTGLLFVVKQSLARLCASLAARCEAVKWLDLEFFFETQGGVTPPSVERRIEPAEPTLDEVQLLDLLRLHLERTPLESNLAGFDLRAEAVAAPRTQRQLFAEKPRRDLKAANRALARIRAEFGDGVVLRARVRDGHLPEARFAWERMDELEPANPEEVCERPRMVRRLVDRPLPLGSHRDPTDGWYLGGFDGGPVQNLMGPYVVSGGWWRRSQHREYYFVETRAGHLLWVYFDRVRRRWFLQGTVE